MKKIGTVAAFLALTIGIGFLQWLAIAFCINCTGTVPMFLGY